MVVAVVVVDVLVLCRRISKHFASTHSVPERGSDELASTGKIGQRYGLGEGPETWAGKKTNCKK